MVLYNQQSSYRSTNQYGRNQSKGGSGHAYFQTRRISQAYKSFSIGSSCSMTTDHGDGTGQQCIGDFNAKKPGKNDADGILTNGNDTGNQPV